MKARFALALVLGSLAAAMTMAVARAEVEFAGYMRTPQGEARFVLADPAVQKTSEWIGLGGNFAGYRVTGFEAKGETLAVEKDGVARQLRLKSAAVVAPAPAGSPKDLLRDSSSQTQKEIMPSQVIMMQDLLKAKTKMLEIMREAKATTLEKQRQAEVETGQPLSEESRAKANRMMEFMNEEIAKVAAQIDRDAVELDRAKRSLLLRNIRAHEGGDPQEIAALQGELRELDARLAKAGAAVESPAR